MSELGIPSRTTCNHDQKPCPVCAGLDFYKPDLHEPVTKCNAKEMQKKLCLDGYGCWCEAMDTMSENVTTGDVRLELGWTQDECDKPPTWKKDGSVNDEGMALYWLDRYLEAERELKELRGKGMLGLRKCRCDESNAEEEGEIWCI